MNQNIIIIIAIILLFFVVWGWQLNANVRQHIIDNWDKYKCKPYILPIAGFFRKSGEKLSFVSFTSQNFQKCAWVQVKGFFKYLIKPIQYIMSLIIKVVEGFRSTLNVFRAEAKRIRDAFQAIVGSVADKMENSYAAIQFYIHKLRNILKQQMAVFTLLMYFIESLKLTMESLVNGPLIDLVKFFPVFGVALLALIAICTLCLFGGPFTKMVACPICLVCFSGKSQCKMDNGTLQSIQDIQLGDILDKGGVVSSLYEFLVSHRKCHMYDYHGIRVSGSHIVYGNKINRIEDDTESCSICYQENKIYCLNTNNRYIGIQGSRGIEWFSDFFENKNTYDNMWHQYLIETELNKNFINNIHYTPYFYYQPHDYEWGFDPLTKVRMDGGSTLSIQDIKLGMRLAGGQEVYGLVQHSTKGMNIYQYGNILVSGTQLVCEKGRWIRVYQSGLSKMVERKDDEIIYHLVCDDHSFNLANGLLVRDYLELREDHPIFETILNNNLHSVKMERKNPKCIN